MGLDLVLGGQLTILGHLGLNHFHIWKKKGVWAGDVTYKYTLTSHVISKEIFLMDISLPDGFDFLIAARFFLYLV